MAALTEWKVPPSAQPRAEDYPYDLERALSSVVGLHSIIPPDGFTAETLGVERAGNGVLIDNGLVLTIGYLITEAQTVWLHLGDGHVVEGHALGLDQETGFGLVQALGKIDLPALPIGSSRAAEIDERVVIGGAGGRTRSLAGRIAAKQEFAGYWEYVLDEAIFTYSGASQLGRHRADLAQGRIDRHRLAAARARARGQERAPQHGGADRPVEADPRRPAQIRPRRQAGAALARALFDRDREQDRRRRHRAQGPGRARGAQDRRRGAGGQGRERDEPRRLLSESLVARPSRRRSAAHALSRRRHLRRAGEFVRPRPSS